MKKKFEKTFFLGLCLSLFLQGEVNGLGNYALVNVSTFPTHFSGDAEYLYWTTTSIPEPVPLVTEGASVVLGKKNISSEWRSGGRFKLGCSFDDCLPLERCNVVGIDVCYLFLPRFSKKMEVVSNGLEGSPNYNIPFFNVLTNEEDSKPLSLTGVFAGTGTLKVHNSIQGAEINGYLNIEEGNHLEYGLLAGFRYFNLTESVAFHVNSPYTLNPDVWITEDSFHARNNFYGGQIGVNTSVNYCNFFADATLKIALGAICKEASISGHLLTNDFTNRTKVQKFPGGYFTMPTNIGHQSQTSFSVMPEVNLNIRYLFTDYLKLTVGYTFIYVSEVLRAGNEINRNINPTQSVTIEDSPNATLVGEAAPQARLKSSSFWTQGINAGVEFNF